MRADAAQVAPGHGNIHAGLVGEDLEQQRAVATHPGRSGTYAESDVANSRASGSMYAPETP